MSAGEIAATIAAGAFVLLVLLVAIPLLKLGRTLDEATLAIRQTREATTPLIASVSNELEQVGSITKDVSSMTSNAAALTSVASATLGSPLIKIAAFSYGVRRTISQRRDTDAVRAAKQERKS